MNSTISRRDALRLAGGAAAATAVAARPGLARSAPARQDVHEIIHWSSLTASDAEIWEEMIAAFNEAHLDQGVQIRMEVVPSDQYGAKVLSSAVVGQAPDFGWGAAGTRLDWISQGVMVPLDDLFSELGFDLSDFSEQTITASRYDRADGQLYHMPMDALSLQVLLNADHAIAAGLDPAAPPQTGEELLAWADQMTVREGDTVTRSGWLMTGSGIQPSVVWGIVAHQMGFRRASDDLTQAALNPEAGAAAAQWVLDLFDTHRVSSRDVADRYLAFGTGEASMFLTGPWTLTGYLEQGINLTSFQMPQVGQDRSTFINIWGLEMYAQRDEGRYAQTAQALQWLSDNSFLWTTKGRGVSPRTSIVEREDYRTAGHPWEARGAFVEGMANATIAQIPVKAAPDFEIYTADQLVARTMDPVWAGESGIEEAIDSLATQWQSALDAG